MAGARLAPHCSPMLSRSSIRCLGACRTRTRRTRTRRTRTRGANAVALAVVAALACDGGRDQAESAGPLIVYSAGSLARPLRAALERFSAAEGVSYQLESAGSLETARKLTELDKI